VPDLSCLTWEELADCDQMLGEAIDEVKAMMSVAPVTDPHAFEGDYYPQGQIEVGELPSSHKSISQQPKNLVEKTV